MKLITLSIKNVRSIRAAEFNFEDKTLVEIRGKNGAGKSTVIDSILFLLKGSRDIPAGVVTNGEERGVIVGIVGEYTIRRVISADGASTLAIEGPTGKVPSPQAFLDQLAGKFLDPEYFKFLPSDQKRALLLRYAGIDFTAIDSDIMVAEQNRLVLGRLLKTLGTVGPEPEKVASVSVAELLKQRNEIETFNREQAAQKEANTSRVETVKNRIIERLRAGSFATFVELASVLESTINQYNESVKAIKDWVDVLPAKPLDEIDAALSGTEENNRQADAHKEWVTRRDNIAAKQAEYDAADKAVADLREKKHNTVAGAKMPIKDLEITDTGLAFRGVSDQNWSDSEALKIALNIAIAYSGDLKAIYIKRGEALDSASLEKIRAYAEKKDFQIIVEIVDDSYAKQGDGVIYIEDGAVR